MKPTSIRTNPWRAACYVLSFAVVLGAQSAANGMYDPKHGRWFQRDPVGIRSDTPAGSIEPQRQYGDGMNLHQYGQSIPTRYVDPSGLWLPTVHASMTDSVLRLALRAADDAGPEQCGRMIRIVIDANTSMDLLYNRKLHMHFNRAPGEGRDDAIQDYQKIIRDHLKEFTTNTQKKKCFLSLNLQNLHLFL